LTLNAGSLSITNRPSILTTGSLTTSRHHFKKNTIHSAIPPTHPESLFHRFCCVSSCIIDFIVVFFFIVILLSIMTISAK
jgi:hypothetical protein